MGTASELLDLASELAHGTLATVPESPIPSPPPVPTPPIEPPPPEPIAAGSPLHQHQELFGLQERQLKALNASNREQLDQLAGFIERLGLVDLAYQREQLENIADALSPPANVPDAAQSEVLTTPQ